MSFKIRNTRGVTRRALLAGFGSSAAIFRAFAQSDDPLQQLIQQNQRDGLGENFDSTSRTIAMPKAPLPTLSSAIASSGGCTGAGDSVGSEALGLAMVRQGEAKVSPSPSRRVCCMSRCRGSAG